MQNFLKLFLLFAVFVNYNFLLASVVVDDKTDINLQVNTYPDWQPLKDSFIKAIETEDPVAAKEWFGTNPLFRSADNKNTVKKLINPILAFRAWKETRKGGGADAKLLAEHEQLKRAVTSATDALANSYSSSPTTRSPSSLSENVNTEEMAKKLHEAAALKQAENEQLAKEKAALQVRLDRVQSSTNAASASVQSVSNLISGVSGAVSDVSAKKDSLGLYMQGFVAMIGEIQSNQALAGQFEIQSATVASAVEQTIAMLTDLWAEKEAGTKTISAEVLKKRTNQQQMQVDAGMVEKAFAVLRSKYDIVQIYCKPAIADPDKFLNALKAKSNVLDVYISLSDGIIAPWSDKAASMSGDPLDSCFKACDIMLNFLNNLKESGLVEPDNCTEASAQVKNSRKNISDIIKNRQKIMLEEMRVDTAIEDVKRKISVMTANDASKKSPLPMIFLKYAPLAFFYLQEAYFNPSLDKTDGKPDRRKGISKGIDTLVSDISYLTEVELKALYMCIYEIIDRFDFYVEDLKKKLPVKNEITKTDFESLLGIVQKKLSDINKARARHVSLPNNTNIPYEFLPIQFSERKNLSASSTLEIISKIEKMISGGLYRDSIQGGFTRKIADISRILSRYNKYRVADMRNLRAQINQNLTTQQQAQAPTSKQEISRHDSVIRKLTISLDFIDKFILCVDYLEKLFNANNNNLINQSPLGKFLDGADTQTIEEIESYIGQFSSCKVPVEFETLPDFTQPITVNGATLEEIFSIKRSSDGANNTAISVVPMPNNSSSIIALQPPSSQNNTAAASKTAPISGVAAKKAPLFGGGGGVSMAEMLQNQKLAMMKKAAEEKQQGAVASAKGGGN